MKTENTAAHPQTGNAQPRRLLRLNEAARLASCHPATIRRAVEAGKLEARKLGTSTVITHDSFDRWIDGLPRLSVKSA